MLSRDLLPIPCKTGQWLLQVCCGIKQTKKTTWNNHYLGKVYMIKKKQHFGCCSHIGVKLIRINCVLLFHFHLFRLLKQLDLLTKQSEWGNKTVFLMVQRNAFILKTDAETQMIESGEELFVAMFFSICISFYIEYVNMQLYGSTLLYICNNLDVHISGVMHSKIGICIFIFLTVYMFIRYLLDWLHSILS